MSPELYALDQAYGSMLMDSDPAVYAGYLKLAAPIVERMKRSRLFTRVVWMLAKPWALEMAHQMGAKRGSVVGKVIMAIGYPMCRKAARKALGVAV